MQPYLMKSLICSIMEGTSLTFLVGPYLRPRYSKKLSYLIFLVLSIVHDAYFSMYSEMLPKWISAAEVAVFYPLFALFIYRFYYGSTLKNYCMCFAYRAIYQLVGMFSSMIPILWINDFDMNAAYEWANGNSYNGLGVMLVCYLIMFPTCYFLFRFYQSKERKSTSGLFVILAIFDVVWLVAPTIGVITVLPVIIIGIIIVFFIMQQQEDGEIAEIYKYYTEILDNTQKQEMKLSMIRHDLANHLSAIEGLESGKEYGDIVRNIDSLKHNWTQVPILDCLIVEKNRIAEQKGVDLGITSIAFTADQKQQVNLVTIFSNILDNGIDACVRASNVSDTDVGQNMMGNREDHIENIKKKRCSLEIKMNGEYLCIVMENDKLSGENPIKNGFRTTKRNKADHGLGHRILKRTVNNMDGRIIYDDKGDKFVTKILVRIGQS